MRVGLIGEKWLGEQIFESLPSYADVLFVAAPDADDRLARAAADKGVRLFFYGEAGLSSMACDDRCDLLITAGSCAFVPAALRACSAWSIGYHPSLLPLHRGRAAVTDAIRAGDRITGGTVYHLTDQMDGGDVVFQEWCFIRDGETEGDLWRRSLAPMGVDLIGRAVDHLEGYGFLPATAQECLMAGQTA